MKKLVVFISALVIITSCGREYGNEDFGKMASVVEDGFELTITTGKNEYSFDRLFNKIFNVEPFDIFATLKYTGDRDEITILHGSPIIGINIVNSNGDIEPLYTEIKGEEVTSILKHGQEVTESFNLQEHNCKTDIIPGAYTAEAWVDLTLYNEDERIVINVGVPFSIVE